jgi:spore maturation protein CgeB
MSLSSLNVVILGLSITSSWGNGHATTYRGLVRGLSARGHNILFLERDAPWYATNRDMPFPPFCRTELYSSLEDLSKRFALAVRNADFVMVGSYVPEGAAVGAWVLNTARGVTGFYDIDTPVTLAKLSARDCEYLDPCLVSQYDIYLSFTGGPILHQLEQEYGAKRARAFYCSADPELYFPQQRPKKWDMGYLGTYSRDRQPALDLLMIEPARKRHKGRFVVAGPQYPDTIPWPQNVERIDHVSPDAHRGFYNSQKFTLNITRAEMIRTGYSPSVRLFEAAACGTPIISDSWDGLETIFEFGSEILISRSPEDTLLYLHEVSDDEAHAIGKRARERVLSQHTADHRAAELEFLIGMIDKQPWSWCVEELA